jgi:hypothetical protein
MKTRTALLALLTIVCLLLAVAPAMADTLYDNGPYNGTTYAWAINSGYAVSDSFQMTGFYGECNYTCVIEGLSFVYWDDLSWDVLTTVDMSIGSTPFGADYYSRTLTGVTNTFLGTNQYGWNLFRADYSLFFGEVSWLNAYLTLQNACTTGGCSYNEIFWDENSGIGCGGDDGHGGGCPSTAYENYIGTIPSEAFTVIGTDCYLCYSYTPEPSSILLFGSGILGLVGMLRRKLGR